MSYLMNISTQLLDIAFWIIGLSLLLISFLVLLLLLGFSVYSIVVNIKTFFNTYLNPFNYQDSDFGKNSIPNSFINFFINNFKSLIKHLSWGIDNYPCTFIILYFFFLVFIKKILIFIFFILNIDDSSFFFNLVFTINK